MLNHTFPTDQHPPLLSSFRCAKNRAEANSREGEGGLLPRVADAGVSSRPHVEQVVIPPAGQHPPLVRPGQATDLLGVALGDGDEMARDPHVAVVDQPRAAATGQDVLLEEAV